MKCYKCNSHNVQRVTVLWGLCRDCGNSCYDHSIAAAISNEYDGSDEEDEIFSLDDRFLNGVPVDSEAAKKIRLINKRLHEDLLHDTKVTPEKTKMAGE